MSIFKSIKIKKCLKKIEPDVDKRLMELGLLKIINGKKEYAFGSVNTKWQIQKELMIERQRKILEEMNKINIEEFYPLKFIAEINYWSIILCGGGYFSYALFLKDKEIEHKSDHKYLFSKK